MASLDPHDAFGGHGRDAPSWLGMTVAFLTVLLALLALLLL